MPTLIVEDGSIVPGANSFITTAYVDAYAAARNRTEWNGTGSQSLKDAAVLEGGDYLKNEMRYQYRGTRISYLQTMPYPRTGATEFRGPAIPNNVVPWRCKDAQAELSIRAYASPGTLQADLERGGAVKMEKVDVIEVEYFDKAPIETLIRTVQGLLQPLLFSDGSLNPVPYKAEPDDPTAFQDGVFNNPASSTLTVDT